MRQNVVTSSDTTTSITSFMSQMLFKTGGQCLAIFWFVKDNCYRALRNMGTWKPRELWCLRAVLEGLHSMPLVKYLKVRGKLPFWHPGAVQTYFGAEIELAMSCIFIVQYTSLNVWDRLLSAAHLAC